MFARWLVNALALFATSYLIQGIHIEGVWAGILAALVLGIVNAFIRPLLLLLTLPLNIMTLGLFTLVVNALMLLLVSAVVRGFDVAGFWPALLGSIVLSVVSGLLSRFIR